MVGAIPYRCAAVAPSRTLVVRVSSGWSSQAGSRWLIVNGWQSIARSTPRDRSSARIPTSTRPSWARTVRAHPYPVRLLCRVLQVSTSAFYDWIGRGQPVVSEDDLDDAHAANQLRDAWVEHRRTYGARRLTAEIGDRDQHGQAWNRKKVARLMTVAGIGGIHRRRRGKKRSRIATGSVAPDLVKRQFVAEGPDQLWVADISYLRTWEGFLHLAVVLDACTHRVVGWAMADHLRRELVLDALGMALQQRRPGPGLVHHSDHGVQYTSIDLAGPCAGSAWWRRWAASAMGPTTPWPKASSPPSRKR
jgi:hypothetical protein